MNAVIRNYLTPYRLAAIISLALIAFVGLFYMSQAGAASPSRAPGGRLVTIHDRGQEKVILTYAPTVKDALSEVGIKLDDKDMVEPSLDEEFVATDYTVNIYRAHPVVVVDGPIRQKVMTPHQTAREIANDAGVQLRAEDKISIRATDNLVGEGASMEMVIDRATEFSLVLYGRKTAAYTQTETVGAMLKAKNIQLGADDTLSVPESTPITAGMSVEIWRDGKQTITEDQAIPFAVEKIQDADREVGFREVKTPGTNGKKTVTYEIEMKNGREVSRRQIQSVTIEEPKKQVEIVGAKMKNTFSGSFSEALARLRSCEGSYTSNTGNGYYGAYQFDRQTWGGYGGFAVASDAPPSVQDQKAWETYQRRGWQPWPSCKVKMGLQDIYR